MPEQTSNYLAALAKLAEKVAVELVYSTPDRDEGLLPVNSLLGEMEEIGANAPLLLPLPQALAQARNVVDSAFEKACFDAGQIEHLRVWVNWMQHALTLAQAGKPLPPLPAYTPAAASASAPPVTVAASPSSSVLPPEEPLVMNIESDGELLHEFINESAEHLQNIELGVLTLEENPKDADTLNSIFRAFHTFKGGSGFLNLIPMKNLAHELESLLDLARNHKLAVNLEIINVILEGGDTLKRFIAEMTEQVSGSKPHGPIVVPAQALLARVRILIQGPGAAPSGGHPVPAASAAPAPVVASAPATVSPAPTPVPTAAAASAPAVPAKADAAVHKDSGAAKAGAGAVVKVDTLKLDSLVDLVGEMVIAQSLIAQDKDLASLQSQKLARNLAQLGRITNDLQRTAMSMRMVPIRATFQKMTRLVRDTVARIGKQAELVLEGEDTELDRTIVEEISDPLIHMVRNSVDHGIEMPEAGLPLAIRTSGISIP